MNTQNLEKTFKKMKAGFKIIKPTREGSGYSIDVKAGTFIITAPDEEKLALNVVDFDLKDRHLLLNISSTIVNGNKTETHKDKWLCGHDERDWFVGAVPKSAVKTIFEAKESLKPSEVIAAEQSLPIKHKNKRKNTARIRQGEWFFIPAPDLVVPENLIHKDEPISRGGGSKSHIISEVYREGGRTVYSDNRNIITKDEFEKLKPTEKYRYSLRTVDAAVYARGTVKHADHATITLSFWHKVLMNTENTARGRKNLVFLD